MQVMSRRRGDMCMVAVNIPNEVLYDTRMSAEEAIPQRLIIDGGGAEEG